MAGGEVLGEQLERAAVRAVDDRRTGWPVVDADDVGEPADLPLAEGTGSVRTWPPPAL